MAGLPATPPPTVSVPNAAPETIVVSIWGGPPGPAGEPGSGVSIKGVASEWPPASSPTVGDLYVLPDPLPAGTPVGFAPGEGAVWDGDEWTSTGPLRGPAGEPGPEGPEGPPGPGSAVFEGADEPTTAIEGDLWLKPETDPDGETVLRLNVYTGTAWRPVVGGAAGATTINTVGNPVGLTPDQALPIQQWAEEIVSLAAFRDSQTSFARVVVTSPSWASGDVFGDGNVIATGGAFGELWYGSIISRDGRLTGPGYQMPTPTEQGYLRADLNPDSGWYFAEPVIVSVTEPPTPPGDPALPTIWIDPSDAVVVAAAVEGLSETNPLKYASPMVLEQADGTPIGLSADGQTFHQPLIHGAIPVVIDGKRYLLPVIEE